MEVGLYSRLIYINIITLTPLPNRRGFSVGDNEVFTQYLSPYFLLCVMMTPCTSWLRSEWGFGMATKEAACEP